MWGPDGQIVALRTFEYIICNTKEGTMSEFGNQFLYGGGLGSQMFLSICHCLPSPLTSCPSQNTLIMVLLVTNKHTGTKQLAPRPPPYKNWFPNSDIVPSFVLHIMYSNVLSATIWPSGPHIFWGDLVTLFWILALAGSRNLQFLVTVSCFVHPRTSFQICNTKGLMLIHHQETTIKIITNKQNPRGLTIRTELVHKHVEKIFPGNGKAITNFNILAKTSPG